MEFIRPCSLCGVNRATDRHHLLSQSKHYKKKYGKLIHDHRNLIYLCNGCHLNRSIPKFTEKEFCEKIGIEFKIDAFNILNKE
jgi:hypothetical protein